MPILFILMHVPPPFPNIKLALYSLQDIAYISPFTVIHYLNVVCFNLVVSSILFVSGVPYRYKNECDCFFNFMLSGSPTRYINMDGWVLNFLFKRGPYRYINVWLFFYISRKWLHATTGRRRAIDRLGIPDLFMKMVKEDHVRQPRKNLWCQET